MKNIFKIGILCICMTLFSCDDFLTKIPYNSQSKENSYETPRDIALAVNGCYNGLIGVKRASEVLFNENRSDNATYPNTENISSNYDAFAPAILSVPVASDYVTPYWKACYTLIGRINLVLQNIDVVIKESDHKQYEAEVRFLRGWCMFNMARYFGGLPLVTVPADKGSDALKIGRSTLAQTYAFIEEDLRISAELLESIATTFKPKYGVVNQWAAKALLAKVYMTQGKNSDALPLVEDVYANSKFKLTQNYGDLFVSTLEATKAAEEVLFAVRFTGGGLGIGNTASTLCAHVDISKFGSNLSFWSNSLRTAFETTSDVTLDKRYPITCGEIASAVTPGQTYRKRYPPKVVGLTKTDDTYATAILLKGNDGDLDCHELRFSEVILMLAELRGQNGGGLSLINEVRFRAGVPDLTEDDITNKFGGDFKMAVFNERRLELAFEGHRFFDMLRLGEEYTEATLLNFFKTEPAYDKIIYPNVYVLLEQVIYGDKIDSWRFLLPIPKDELLRNTKIEQNPGYGK